MSIGRKLRACYRWLVQFKRIQVAKKHSKEMAELPTYYPELEQKALRIRKQENYNWARKFGEANNFYTLYGFDVEGLRNQDEYIDYYSFMTSRNAVNCTGQWWNYIVLLRDKFLFYKIMKSNNIPVPEVFCVIKDNKLYDTYMNPMSWDDIKEEKDYFIKDIDGECASFVKHLDNYNELSSNQIQQRITKGTYILQRTIKQHPQMDVINPNSINTLRIVTINKNGSPYILTSLLRVGTSKTGNVDNWAAGGLAIGIKDEHLKEYGYYKPSYGTKIAAHPDTNVNFSSFKIPMYREACELACNAHRCIYGVRAIGWDIAISQDGPVIIEGNDNWEISLQQACDRPLKREWLEACE